jgi:predicted permease
VPEEYPLSRKVATIDAVLSALGTSPAVAAVGFSRAGVLIGEEITFGTFVPPGRTMQEMQASPERTRLRPVSHGFLTAMGIPLLAGRDFLGADVSVAPVVVVMNQSAARLYFGAAHLAVGQRVDWVGGGVTQVTVIGVAENLRNESLAHEPYPEIFVEYHQLLSLLAQWGTPAAQQTELAIGRLSLAVRTHGDPGSAVASVRRLLHAVDPNIGVDAIVPMERLVVGSLARPRFYALSVGAFALVAVVLAIIGVYGMLAYAVVQRTQEIGVRMALGAQRSQVLRVVLRQGVSLALIGIAVGIMGARAGAPLLHGLLFHLSPLDGTTVVVVTGLFAVVAAVASYLPARRATKVDPLVALRTD